MLHDTTTIRNVLKSKGYSLTRPRRQVYLLLQQKQPLKISQIVALLPDINRSSIYRTISLFESLDILHRVQIGWKYMLELSDAFSPHHHHISCVQCHKITEIPEDNNLESLLHGLAAAHGYKPTGHQIEIVGLCSNCQT